MTGDKTPRGIYCCKMDEKPGPWPKRRRARWHRLQNKRDTLKRIKEQE